MFDKYIYNFVLFPALLTIWFFGGVALLQIFFFKEILFHSAHIKLVLVFGILFLWALNILQAMQFNLNKEFKHVYKSYFLWLIFALLLLLFFLYTLPYPPDYILFSFNIMYFYSFLFFFFVFQSKHDAKSTYYYFQKEKVILLTILAIPVIIFGILQGLTDSLFLPNSFTMYYQVYNFAEFIGSGTRAISIFPSGLAFGEFSLFMLLIWLSYLFSKKRKFPSIAIFLLLILLALTAIFLTLTRVIYIQTILSIFSLFLLKNHISRARSFIFLSIIIAIVVNAIIFFIVIVYVKTAENSIASNVSLFARMDHWAKVIDMIFSEGDGVSMIFGNCLIANNRYDFMGHLVIDNVYLAYLLHSGVLGLIIFSIFIFAIFKHTVRNALLSKNPVWTALAAFYFSVPAGGFLTDKHNIPQFLLLLTISIAPYPLNIKRTYSVLSNKWRKNRI